MWKETVVAKFKLSSQHFPRWTEKNNGKPRFEAWVSQMRSMSAEHNDKVKFTVMQVNRSTWQIPNADTRHFSQQ